MTPEQKYKIIAMSLITILFSATVTFSQTYKLERVERIKVYYEGDTACVHRWFYKPENAHPAIINLVGKKSRICELCYRYELIEDKYEYVKIKTKWDRLFEEVENKIQIIKQKEQKMEKVIKD